MPAAPDPAAGEVAIVELLINPSGTDTGREWIEIQNRSGHAVSLKNLHIADGLNEAAVEFPGVGGDGGPVPEPLMAPSSRALLIQSADLAKNGGIAPGPGTLLGTIGTRVSLNNSADQITLCTSACAAGVVIDRVSWDATLGAGYDGHALQIDDAGRRCPATSPFGDAGSFGTPLQANDPCP